MIYKGIVYETKCSANFFNEQWHISYILVQTRRNLEDITEKRELIFTIESDCSYDVAYRKLMRKAFDALQPYNFDLFKMPDDDFLSLKARLENVATENNSASEN